MPSSTLDLASEAIEAADVTRLRKTLRSICARSNTALNLVCEELLLPKNPINKSTIEDDASAESASTIKEVTRGVKRGTDYEELRYQTCKQCDKEYDVQDNNDGSCEWHDGELERDEDWCDWDDGLIDDDDEDFQKEEYPEGFIWACCDRRGDDDEFCKHGKHVPKETRKRSKARKA